MICDFGDTTKKIVWKLSFNFAMFYAAYDSQSLFDPVTRKALKLLFNSRHNRLTAVEKQFQSFVCKFQSEQ